MTISMTPSNMSIKDEATGVSAGVDSDNRLLVAAKVDAEVDVYYHHHRLVNGSAYNMAVNGSGTSQEFVFTASGSEIHFVDELVVFMDDTNVSSWTGFGARSALTNGLYGQIKTLGTTYDLFNLKDNIDLYSTFHENRTLPRSAGALGGITYDTYMGSIRFHRPITLKGANSDFVKVTVRDDLSGINNIRMHIQTWHKIT